MGGINPQSPSTPGTESPPKIDMERAQKFTRALCKTNGQFWIAHSSVECAVLADKDTAADDHMFQSAKYMKEASFHADVAIEYAEKIIADSYKEDNLIIKYLYNQIPRLQALRIKLSLLASSLNPVTMRNRYLGDLQDGMLCDRPNSCIRKSSLEAIALLAQINSAHAKTVEISNKHLILEDA